MEASVEVPPEVERVITQWDSQPREAALKTIHEYGPPAEATDTRLVWFETGPWKRTIVHRDPVPHRFPKPHNDLLEQTIPYRVPPDKFDDLAAFDGSVIVERTKGEMSARCDKEEMNYLALNLAHDIVTGRVDVDEARRVYTETAAKFMMGRHDPYTQGLHFQPTEEDAADPDEITVDDTMTHKIKQTLGVEE